MSVNRIDYFVKQIDVLDSYLEKDDFDALEAGFIDLDKELRKFFDKLEGSNEDELEPFRHFYQNFQNLIERTEIKKQALAKQLGSHLSNQKKLDVYKSIK